MIKWLSESSGQSFFFYFIFFFFLRPFCVCSMCLWSAAVHRSGNRLGPDDSAKLFYHFLSVQQHLQEEVPHLQMGGWAGANPLENVRKSAFCQRCSGMDLEHWGLWALSPCGDSVKKIPVLMMQLWVDLGSGRMGRFNHISIHFPSKTLENITDSRKPKQEAEKLGKWSPNVRGHTFS